MFAFLNNALASASQRYISYELAKNENNSLNQVYSSLVIVYIGLCLAILLLGETFGYWFVSFKLDYDSSRSAAVFWVYQFSLFSLIITVFSSCYNAVIIAYEKMKIYAYISIFEALLKLIIIYLLIKSPLDKIVSYAFLLLLVNIIITLIYRLLSRRYCSQSVFHFYWDSKLLKELISFSGWNLFGSISGVLRSQGINILLNVFFGTLVNAARGISYQVYGAIHNFSNNFITAVKPQLIKSYSVGDKQGLYTLLYLSTKASFFLLFFLSVPVMLNLRFLLDLWLTTYPDETKLFTELVLVNLLIESISNPLMVLAQATGNVKKYQIVVGIVLLLNVPVSYLLFKIGCPSYACFIAMIVISLFALISRLQVLKEIANLNIFEYAKKVLVRVLIVVVLVSLISISVLFVKDLYTQLSFFLLSTFISMTSIVLFSFFFGLETQERRAISNIIKNKKFYYQI